MSDVGYLGAYRLKERLRLRYCHERTCYEQEIEGEEEFDWKAFQILWVAVFHRLHKLLYDVATMLVQQHDPSEKAFSCVTDPLHLEELPEGFVTASVMDLFHYYNEDVCPDKDKGGGASKEYSFNIGPHSDNSILTLIPLSEVRESEGGGVL